VEYIGEAKAGLASGTGGMIMRRAGKASPDYYEGEFSKGLPNGVVLYEQAGSRSGIYSFKAGREIGKATENQWKRLQL
jgi:hypothetical protein